MKHPRVVPVLPSADILRDLEWYESALGFKRTVADKMYAVLEVNGIEIHLQWHAGNEEDPLLGGSVIKVFDVDVDAWYKQITARGVVNVSHPPCITPWGTYEFGCYDLNKNAVFFCVDVEKKA